jgi:hypothetical protein
VDPQALLAAAEQAEAACDLEHGLPDGAARLADATLALLDGPALTAASPRALWNVLWLAGDLTAHVDLYRAARLLDGVAGVFERHLQHASGDLADAAEMAFDFFFNRPPGEQPLVIARLNDAVGALSRVLTLDSPLCRRAALHGLGHLRQTCDPPARDRVDAVFDTFLRETTDASLATYAARARAGELP